MRKQFKNILCATDFSDFSNHTVSYGVAFAKEFEAKLFICHVIDLSSSVTVWHLPKSLRPNFLFAM
jgi:nucleotide-binding universal stress UspA family protein